LTHVQIITQPSQWRAALSQLGRYDFVHTYDYHQACQALDGSQPVAFAVCDDAGQVVGFWPTLRREIPQSERVDLTSVYGYGGPIVAAPEYERQCLELTFEHMRRAGAVSLFSRMHPLFPVATEEYRGSKLSDVVVIQVAPTDDPMSTYRGSHRREIANALRQGVSVVVDNSNEGRADFQRIYKAAMDEIGASTQYYFSNDFFKRIFEATDFRVDIYFAEYHGERIASSLFLTTGSIVQYFLSGTSGDWRKLAPSKVIIANLHERALSASVDNIILGGGVGSAHDSLFKFKAGFSSVALPFFVTKKILDDRVYADLSGRMMNQGDGTGFFPAYRA
jgi:hypothetical protein